MILPILRCIPVVKNRAQWYPFAEANTQQLLGTTAPNLINTWTWFEYEGMFWGFRLDGVLCYGGKIWRLKNDGTWGEDA